MVNYRFITYFRRGAWKSVGWLVLVSLAACGIVEQRAANQPALVPGPIQEQELPAGTAAATTGGVAAPTAAPAATSVGAWQMYHMAKLEPLLFQSGDLPGTIAGEPTDNPIPPNVANDPPASTIVGRRLTRDGRAAGSVTLLFYDNPSDLAQAYGRLTANADPFAAQPNAMEPRTDVGDKAVTGDLMLASSTYGPTHTVVVIFARCHVIIDIRLNEQPDLILDTAVAYAKRVDQRIAVVVCS